MSELHFFATEPDHEAIIEMLVSGFQAVFVLDGLAPPLRELTDAAEIRRIVRESPDDPRFYVLSPRWTREPLSVGEVTGPDGRVRHFIRARHGGPAFDYLVRRPRVGDREPQVPASWFLDDDVYYSQERPGEPILRPSAMADAQRAVRRLIAAQGLRTTIQELGRAGPMAMAGARHAWQAGSWLRMGDWHHVPRLAAR